VCGKNLLSAIDVIKDPGTHFHPDVLAETGCGFDNGFAGYRILKLGVNLCQWDHDERQFPKFIMAGPIVKKDRVNIYRTGCIFVGGPYSAQFRFDRMDDLCFQFSERSGGKK